MHLNLIIVGYEDFKKQRYIFETEVAFGDHKEPNK
jgi:hypothetical protein